MRNPSVNRCPLRTGGAAIFFENVVSDAVPVRTLHRLGPTLNFLMGKIELQLNIIYGSAFKEKSKELL